MINATCAVIAGLYLCYISLTINIGKKPILFPFYAYKNHCRKDGKTSVISENKDYFSDIFTHLYIDQRYKTWRDEILKRDTITQLEYMALQQQTILEMENKLKEYKLINIKEVYRGIFIGSLAIGSQILLYCIVVGPIKEPLGTDGKVIAIGAILFYFSYNVSTAIKRFIKHKNNKNLMQVKNKR